MYIRWNDFLCVYDVLSMSAYICARSIKRGKDTKTKENENYGELHLHSAWYKIQNQKLEL